MTGKKKERPTPVACCRLNFNRQAPNIAQIKIRRRFPNHSLALPTAHNLNTPTIAQTANG